MLMISRIKLALAVLLGRTNLIASRSLTVFPDDLFIVSYPRSGNTWTRFLVGNLISQDEPISFANIERRVPDIYQNSDQLLKRLPRPRVLKSHEYFDPRYGRVIMIVRDPRDVAVSYYHYQVKVRRLTDGYPMDDFVSSFVACEIGRYGSWGENVGSWIGAREGTEGFLLLRYEDMLKEPVQELAKIAEFLSVDASREQLEQVVELNSADRMRRLEREQAASWRPIQKSRKDKPFVRTAIAGSWRDELSDSAAKRIEATWTVQMKHFGYLG
jgi:hypothetical protein